MPSLKTLYSQSVIYGLSTILPRFLNYLLVYLHTRVFLPQEYGIITELYAYVTFFLILLTFGLETGFFRFASSKEDINKVYPTTFYFLLSTSILGSIIFTILSTKIATNLGNQYDPNYIIILGIIITLDAFSALPFAKLRYLNKPLTFSLIKVLGVLLNVFLNILFLFIIPKERLDQYFGSISLINYVFIANLIQSFVTAVAVLIYTKIPEFKIDRKLLGEILIYSAPLLLAGLGGTTNESFDRVFLRFLLPVEENPQYQLGIYGSNSKLAVLMLLFIQMYRFAAEPFFFQNLKDDKTGVFFKKAFNAFLIFCLIIFLLVSLNIPIIKLFVGSNFRESLLIIPIMLVANILYGTFFNFSFWYKLDNKTLYGVKYTFIGAGFTVLFNIILIPNIGIYGAALSRVLCYSIMNLLVYYDGKKSGFVQIDIKKVVVYVSITLLIFAFTMGIYYWSTFISVLVGNMLIAFFIWFIFRKEEISLRYILRRSNGE